MISPLPPLRSPGRLAVAVGVVPLPPLVRVGLRVTLRRVFPLLLSPERRDVEVAPRAAHRLVTAIVDEVGAEHVDAVPDERVRAVPFGYIEVGVEAVLDCVPGNLPPHSCLQPVDVRLRRARRKRKS